MSSETTFKCDRCKATGILHFRVEIGPEQWREVDFCLLCASNGMLLLLNGMGYRMKNAWLTEALKAD
jgi:hypothetical protein